MTTFAAKKNLHNGKRTMELASGNGVYSREQEVADRLESRVREAEIQLSKPLTPYEIEDLEKRTAFEYAKENGLWFDDFYSLGDHILQGGNENTLVAGTKNNVVYKSNNLLNSKGRISNLLKEVEIHNQLFPETKYELAGFTGLENGANRVPYVEPILKQDYVPNATQATQQEIADFMAYRGFDKMNEHTFTNGKYTVSDLHPRNVLKNKAGNIFVVDDIVSENQQTETIKSRQ